MNETKLKQTIRALTDNIYNLTADKRAQLLKTNRELNLIKASKTNKELSKLLFNYY